MRRDLTERERYAWDLVVVKAEISDLRTRVEAVEERLRAVKVRVLSDIEALSASSDCYSGTGESLSEEEVQAADSAPLEETGIGRLRLELIENRAARMCSSGIFEREAEVLTDLRNELKRAEARLEKLLKGNPATNK